MGLARYIRNRGIKGRVITGLHCIYIYTYIAEYDPNWLNYHKTHQSIVQVEIICADRVAFSTALLVQSEFEKGFVVEYC